jgi:hypothetical protein
MFVMRSCPKKASQLEPSQVHAWSADFPIALKTKRLGAERFRSSTARLRKAAGWSNLDEKFGSRPEKQPHGMLETRLCLNFGSPIPCCLCARTEMCRRIFVELDLAPKTSTGV